MPITFVGFNAATADTVSLPGGWSAGNLAVAHAHNIGGSIPSLPTGWTSLAAIQTGTGGTDSSSRVGYRELQAGDTDIGTWTNADHVQVIVLADASPVGGAISTDASAVPNFPNTTPNIPDGNTWWLGFGGHNQSTSMRDNALSGWTNRSVGGPGHGGTATWTQPNVTGPYSTQNLPTGASGLGTAVIQEIVWWPAPPGGDTVEPDPVTSAITIPAPTLAMQYYVSAFALSSGVYQPRATASGVLAYPDPLAHLRGILDPLVVTMPSSPAPLSVAVGHVLHHEDDNSTSIQFFLRSRGSRALGLGVAGVTVTMETDDGVVVVDGDDCIIADPDLGFVSYVLAPGAIPASTERLWCEFKVNWGGNAFNVVPTRGRALVNLGGL